MKNLNLNAKNSIKKSTETSTYQPGEKGGHVRSLLMLCCVFVLHFGMNGQSVIDPSSQPGYDVSKAALISQTALAAVPGEGAVVAVPAFAPEAVLPNCFVPLDNTFDSIPRNDDGSFGPVALPFQYNLYGTLYNSVFINTNGNLTFNNAFSSFTPSGFPIGTPMVAAFWGDVDTRGGAGAIHYKVSPTNLIVTFDGVGYFGSHIDKLNTFQIIIGTLADTLTGIGNNVAFNYGDMQWTTGDASSGVNGFGGSAATVGANKGDGVSFFQFGRFSQDNSTYDGPGGNEDGVSFLDNQCLQFNTSNDSNIAPILNGVPSGAQVNLNCGDTANINISAIAPELGQNVTFSVNLNGLCNVDTTIVNGAVASAAFEIIGALCNQGTTVINITATDDGIPIKATTVNITVNVGACCDTTPVNISDSICPGDSLFVGGAFQTVPGVYNDTLAGANSCDSVVITTLSLRDSAACADDSAAQACLTVVSDNTWMKSTVVGFSNLSGFWPGSPGLPGTGTFTDPVTMGQPYNYPSIQVIENSQVISTGPSVTYFRKEFILTNSNDLDVRLLVTADDQAEIFLNGQQAALISTFGRPNYKFPAHDVKFGSGVVSNGFMGGDSYDVTAIAATVSGALQVGVNEVIVAVRNLGKPSDMGGFSFRMDINCDDNGITEKSGEATFDNGALEVFPNPVQEMLTIRNDISITSIRVFDFSGKLVQDHTYAAEKQVKINMQGLARGVYFIEVGEVGNTLQRIKVMKD